MGVNNGIKLLDKLYKDLYKTKEVRNAIKRNKNVNNSNKYEDIIDYLNRLERIHKLANTSEKRDILLNFYYDKYVVKEDEIPNKLNKNIIIDTQKEGIKKWLNYLLDDSLNYPFWAKYWAFQGMVRMGNYDYISSKYTKRTKSTLSPFLELNTDILNDTINYIIKYTNNIKINDEIIDKIIDSGSFSKIYNICSKRNNNYIKKDTNYNDGKWIKYNEGSIEDAIKLSESLKNQPNSWCTKEKNIAINQLCGGDIYYRGDFYVYYTKDKNNKYVVPRIAIRMDGNNEIGEIRGIDDNQNLEEGLELILKKKIDEFKFLSKFEKLDAYKKINDQRKLTIIANKTRDNIDLNIEEKEFLYELNYNISFFGWGCNPLLMRIREERFKKGLIINDLKDEKICNYMINKNGNMLKYVPNEYKTKEICIEALKQNKYSMQFIPDKIKYNLPTILIKNTNKLYINKI